MLLPREPEKQQQLLARAADGYQWISTTCTRNPAACENARVGWVAFSERAQFAVQLAFEAAGKGLAAAQSPVPAPEPASKQGTLSDGDLQLAFEPPKPKKKKASK